MRNHHRFWGHCLQRAAVAVLAGVPVTVWAPNELVKSDLLEITIEYRVIAGARGSGKAFLNESQARHVTDFLNEKLHERGIRFRSVYRETIDDDAADISGAATKATALQRLEKFARPGVITVVVPTRANASAAYLGQPLETGPIALYNGKTGAIGIAHEIGHVFGFTNVCGVANNIMFRDCPGQARARVEDLNWTYFTDDNVAQSFSPALDLWKWEAQSYLLSRARTAADGVWATNTDFLDTPTTP